MMDYSLLIGEILPSEMKKVRRMVSLDSTLSTGLYYSKDGKGYLIRIIDPLTYYGMAKSAEHTAKMAL